MTDGVKYDDGKLDFTLLPYDSLCEVVKVLMYGAKKYPEADNWKRVQDPINRYNKAALRHLFSQVSGENVDSESNLYHLAHSICCNLFALHFILNSNTDNWYCNNCKGIIKPNTHHVFLLDDSCTIIENRI